MAHFYDNREQLQIYVRNSTRHILFQRPFNGADDESGVLLAFAVQSINGIWRVREFRGGSSARKTSPSSCEFSAYGVEIGHIPRLAIYLLSFERGILLRTHGHGHAGGYDGRYFATLDTSETCLA